MLHATINGLVLNSTATMGVNVWKVPVAICVCIECVISQMNFARASAFCMCFRIREKTQFVESKIFLLVTEKNGKKCRFTGWPHSHTYYYEMHWCHLGCCCDIKMPSPLQDFVFAFAVTVTTANYNNHHTMCARATLPAAFVYYVALGCCLHFDFTLSYDKQK